MYYYIIDRKIKTFQDPLDSNLYDYPELTQAQINFYLENPSCSLSEVLNLQKYPIHTSSLDDLKEDKKTAFDSECQTEILSQYPLHKQINITNHNGYSDVDLLTMNGYISDKRNKLAILKEMVDNCQTEEELNALDWSVSLEFLIDTIIASGTSNSLLIAKNKKIKELQSWAFSIQSAGYYDPLTQITLAAKEEDIDAFSRDLTGVNSLLKEAAANNSITVDPYWTFIDINGNGISTLTPTEYVSLLNRYFIALRNVKISYSVYTYYIYMAQSIEDLESIVFGE